MVARLDHKHKPPGPALRARLAPSLEEDQCWAGETMDLVVCPVCRYTYIHVGTVSSNPTAKGSRTVVSLWAECGHSFDLILWTHKGQTFCALENVRHTEPEEWPLGGARVS